MKGSGRGLYLYAVPTCDGAERRKSAKASLTIACIRGELNTGPLRYELNVKLNDAAVSLLHVYCYNITIYRVIIIIIIKMFSPFDWVCIVA